MSSFEEQQRAGEIANVASSLAIAATAHAVANSRIHGTGPLVVRTVSEITADAIALAPTIVDAIRAHREAELGPARGQR